MCALPSILIAEDDEMDVMFLERAFASAEIRHPLIVARDGQEATEMLQDSINANQCLPALMIFDLKMPRRNGLELLQWVRAQNALRCVPVFIHSTSDHSADSERAYALGANSYIVKPSSTRDREQMARFLKEWLVFSRPPIASLEGPAAAQAFLTRR